MALSNVTKFSIWAASCVSLGLLAAAVDGATPLGLAKAALIMASLMVIVLLVALLWQKHR